MRYQLLPRQVGLQQLFKTLILLTFLTVVHTSPSFALSYQLDFTVNFTTSVSPAPGEFWGGNGLASPLDQITGTFVYSLDESNNMTVLSVDLTIGDYEYQLSNIGVLTYFDGGFQIGAVDPDRQFDAPNTVFPGANDFILTNQPSYITDPNYFIYTLAMDGYQESSWRSSNFERYIITALSDPNPVPEPGTLLLLGSGLAGLVLYRRRMNKA